MTLHTDHYEFLGVERDASTDEIRVAYRKFAKRNHPDTAPGDASAGERFKKAQAIYEILNDPEKRQAYDQELAALEEFLAGARGPQPESDTSARPDDPPAWEPPPEWAPPPPPNPSSPAPSSGGQTGQSPNPSSATARAPRAAQPGMATASLIFGLIAFFTTCGPFGVVAVFCGLSAKSEVERRGSCGATWKIGVGLGAASIVFFLILVIALLSGAGGSSS